MEDTPEEAAWREQCWRDVRQWLAEERASEARKARELGERERQRAAERERQKAARLAERQRFKEIAAREKAALDERFRRAMVPLTLEQRKQQEREDLARLDAIWANDLREVKDDEARYYQLNYALALEAGNQQNQRALAAREMARQAANVICYTPFSQLQLIPANAWTALR